VSRLLEVVGARTYADAGVSIEAGDEVVERFKSSVESTFRPGVLGGIGGFGGLFALDTKKYEEPVLVASADGVGTKLEVARLLGRYDTVGVDLVAMLVDDLVCVGAEPLFMLDYVAVGSVNPEQLAVLVAGIANGCRQANVALLGGETAEHGGVMKPDDLDVAGFALGVVESREVFSAQRVRAGDVLVGLHSPGLRSNGYSLAREVLVTSDASLLEPAYEGAMRTLGDELLVPSVIYAPCVLTLRQELGAAVHAVAHVTGGGIVGNVGRLLPDDLDAVIDMESFPTPEIFFEIQRRGPVSAAGDGARLQLRTWHGRRRRPERGGGGGDARSLAGRRCFARRRGSSWNERSGPHVSDARERVREHLLEHSVRRGEFTLKSGRTSTWFIDSKQTICAPDVMVDVAALVLDAIPDDATAIGGLTMGADGVSFITAGVAATRGRALNAFSVRKEVKDHGAGGRIAGVLHAGDRVVITEDTVTRGTSLLEAVHVAQEVGAEVVLILAVVDRGGTAEEMTAKEGLRFQALFTAPDLGFPYEGA